MLKRLYLLNYTIFSSINKIVRIKIHTAENQVIYIEVLITRIVRFCKSENSLN
jgi:hypothetical protein